MKKRCCTGNFDSYSRQISRTAFIGFHKENEKGKEKVVFQGEGIQEAIVQLPYTWGYVNNK